MMRPYRLIGHSELQDLARYYSEIINQWNNDYALNPWSIELDVPKYNSFGQKKKAIISKTSTIALIDQDCVQVFNHVLFGKNNSDFDATSQELMLGLLNKLSKEQCSLFKEPMDAPDWFYPGSTCLSLILSVENKKSTIILNPQSIYDLLPRCKTTDSRLNSIDEALEEQILELNLKLLPFKLSLGELSTLQVGDVITTEHPTNTTCRLTHQEQILALAELGQSSLRKSIILKRFL